MNADETFDYIIAGAGSAGCVLASRLTEDPDCKVLVLEAGGEDKNFLFHWPAGFAKMTKGIASWGWETVPQRHMQGRKVWFTQGKVLGGGSTINAQLYNRGNSEDYDRWLNEANCDGWSYADVLPYFRRAEGNDRFSNSYHGTEGPLGVSVPKGALPICDAFIRAAQEYGIPYNHDFNGAHQAGIGYYQLTQRHLRRSSTATAYLKPAKNRKNLKIQTQSQALRVLLEGKKAVGVEVLQKNKLVNFKTEKEVLLTSGAIGSPRLLMLSGIGPADALKSVKIPVLHSLPSVGCNLQDHIDLCALAECRGPYSYDGVNKPHRALWAGLEYLLFKSGPVTSSLFETGGFWYADPKAKTPDIQFHFGQGSGIEKGIVNLENAGITLNSAFMRPRSSGTVRLASNNPLAAPLIDPNYWAEPYDLEMSLRGLEMAREILSQPALRPFIRKEVLPGSKVKSSKDLFDYACKMAKTDHHPVGTCKMGMGDDAVVALDLKVHGIEGLRVCDASIMPGICSANTNAATIMIAEKASDLVRGQHLPAAKGVKKGPEPKPKKTKLL